MNTNFKVFIRKRICHCSLKIIIARSHCWMSKVGNITRKFSLQRDMHMTFTFKGSVLYHYYCYSILPFRHTITYTFHMFDKAKSYAWQIAILLWIASVGNYHIKYIIKTDINSVLIFSKCINERYIFTNDKHSWGVTNFSF